MSRPGIQISDLTVRYPRAARPALSSLSLEIEPGETVLLLGPSGSGKSTLGRVLAGLIPQNQFARLSGAVQVCGLDPVSAPPGEVAAQVGLLFQDPEAGFATLVVEDEIAFGLENLRVPPAEMPARIQAALERVGMAGFGHRRLETLSGGEAQRVALAGLLAMRPPVLVLDEPTANLDPRGTREFFDTLASLQDEHTILLIEHKLDACFHLADRVVLLDQSGALLATGEPRAVYRDHAREIRAACIWIPDEFEQDAFLEPPASEPPTTRESAVPPAIQVEELTFAYSDGPTLLQHLDLRIPSGAFAALLGANGSGKSTLARLLLALLPRPQGGEVRLFGDPVRELSLGELTRRAGYVFQNPEHQFVTDTVWEELAYSLRARRWPEHEIRSRVEQLLDHFGLEPFAERNPFTLSQGQKRRLSVGTMLAAGQRLLILDEPTFGQDRCTSEALMESLVDLNQEGVTILMITHDMRLVRRYAGLAAVLDQGKIAYQGAAPALFEQQELLTRAQLL